MSIKRTELIDAYLRNELDSEATEAFQSQLAGDPSLREELGFQQQVVRGLGEFRKAELKSRLTAINISTPWWEVGQLINPGLIKLTGALVTATFIGTGIYYFNNLDENPESAYLPTIFEEDLLHSNPENVSFFIEDADEIPEAIALEEVLEKTVVNSHESTESIKDSDASVEGEMAPVESSSGSSLDNEASDAKHEFVPEVDLPNPGDGSEENQFKSESAKIPLASNADIINASDQIDIKTSQRNNDEIKYKYYEGKLHLYGNFKDNPYEILEINSSHSKQVYLYHNYRYYKLLTTDKVLALPQITDRVLIHELEIVRNNKVDQ